MRMFKEEVNGIRDVLDNKKGEIHEEAGGDQGFIFT
jgi:hypothetical protein